MRKTKTMLLTLLVALCMTFSMTVFAAGDGKADVIIQNLSGHGGLLECYKEGETVPCFTKVIPNGAVTFVVEDVEQGNYKMLVKGGVALYEPMQFSVVAKYDAGTMSYHVDDIYLQAKFEKPDLTKSADRKTAKVGDVVTYTLLIDIPQYLESDTNKEFYITDIPSEGLAIDETTVQFYACDEGYQKVGSALVTADVTSVTNGIEGMKIDITDYATFCERVGGTSVILEYQATVTKYANGSKTTENYATLKYRDGEESDLTHVYTYGVRVLKKTKDDKPLTGAVFTLLQDGKVLKFYPELIEDVGYALYSDQDETDTSKYITEIPVDKNGMLILTGLDLGAYTLKEVKAPDGYFISTEEISVLLKDDEKDGKLDTADVVELKKNQVQKVVYNYETFFDVPVTGSWSFGGFLIAGAILMLLGLGLIRYEKKKHTC